MPLQRDQRLGHPGEQRMRAALVGQLDRQQPDLGAVRHRPHLGAERGRQQLHPEADAEERLAVVDRLPHQLLLGAKPRVLGLVVGAHRPAHRQHRVELAPVRQRLALVELDGDRLHPALLDHLGEDAGVLAGDVLQDQQASSRRLGPPRIPGASARPASSSSRLAASAFAALCPRRSAPRSMATSPVAASISTTASSSNRSGRSPSNPIGIESETNQKAWRLMPWRSRRTCV